MVHGYSGGLRHKKIHCLSFNVLFNKTMSALNYHHLRYFWAVAHDGNLTRTAGRLNLSQSALSVQIKQLEERLGHQLFERRGRQLHLTEAGRLTLDHADTIFATGDDLLQTLAEADSPRRRLRIGALATLSRNFQLSFLRPILGRDDVDITMRSGRMTDLLAGLEALAFDVVLINQPPVQDCATNFIANRLAAQRVSLFGTPARIATDETLSGLLTRHPVILPTTESSIRTGFDALVDKLGVKPKIAAEIDDMAMLRLLAREDMGLAVLPPIVVRDELADGTLLEADRLPGIEESFYAITTQRQFPNPLLRDLLDQDFSPTVVAG